MGLTLELNWKNLSWIRDDREEGNVSEESIEESIRCFQVKRLLLLQYNRPCVRTALASVLIDH